MYFLESLSLLLLSMDKFVVREPKKDPHLAVNKSAKDRAAQYPGFFTRTMVSFSVPLVILF